MSYPLTIPQIILVGKTATYLSANEVGENVLYGSRVVKSPDPNQIAVFTSILDWAYSIYGESTRQLANYNMWLYGKFQIQAQSNTMGGEVIIGSGGFVYRTINDTITTQSSTYSNNAFIGAKDFGVLTVDAQEYQLGTGFSINTATGVISLLNGNQFILGSALSISFNQKVA